MNNNEMTPIEEIKLSKIENRCITSSNHVIDIPLEVITSRGQQTSKSNSSLKSEETLAKEQCESISTTTNDLNVETTSNDLLATSSNSSDDEDVTTTFCRICQSDEKSDSLISPCGCTGSVKFVHQSCLVRWMKTSFKTSCELCMTNIKIIKKRKPFSQWRLPTHRPTPLIWVVVFVSAIALNLVSVAKDASKSCFSTPCVVFYLVASLGACLAALFFTYWIKRAKDFMNRWIEQNEEWVVLKVEEIV